MLGLKKQLAWMTVILLITTLSAGCVKKEEPLNNGGGAEIGIELEQQEELMPEDETVFDGVEEVYETDNFIDEQEVEDAAEVEDNDEDELEEGEVVIEPETENI